MTELYKSFLSSVEKHSTSNADDVKNEKLIRIFSHSYFCLATEDQVLTVVNPCS